jgi:multiple sugar transport system ATP-binding protein
VRPESFGLADADTGLPIQVDLIEVLGADAYVYGTSQVADATEKFVIRVDGRVPPRMGDTIRMTVRESEAHFFHPQTGLRLG